MTFFFFLHELLGDVALNNFVSEVPTHRVAAERIDLKALLQRQTAGLESDVHQPRAREISVGENWEHEKPADTTQASSIAQVKDFATAKTLHCKFLSRRLML